MTAVRHYGLEGRLRAVFFRLSALATGLLASGCALDRGPSLGSLTGGPDTAAIEEQAAATPYASLDLEVAGAGGLVILAESTGDMTYWQFADNATIALEQGYLRSTAGLTSDLIDTQVVTDSGQPTIPWRRGHDSADYRVIREWRSADGFETRGEAQASLHCDSETVEMSLPLTDAALQPCRETLEWESGDTTVSTLWRSPRDGRLWAVETQPWPDAPTFSWRIARPW
ncbi:YjbF family lipoprotein [Salinicola avicenniae]|uniref:YjbF family lipoprotein n=1 Tax=Salinicola avicenniae TaxID=2916836 RepID=UPI002072FBE9|nr:MULTISPECIES: YjbF family lipoprotein [unclassified Salinicola]